MRAASHCWCHFYMLQFQHNWNILSSGFRQVCLKVNLNRTSKKTQRTLSWTCLCWQQCWWICQPWQGKGLLSRGGSMWRLSWRCFTWIEVITKSSRQWATLVLSAVESDTVDEAVEGLLTLKRGKKTGLRARSVISITWTSWEWGCGRGWLSL